MLLRAAVASMFLLASSAPALAEPASLAAARASYDQGEFLGALSQLAEAQRSPELTEDGQVQVHWLRGACFHALDRTEEANRSFDALLKMRPLFQPNPYETPPDLRTLFGARADAYRQQLGVSIGAVQFNKAELEIGVQGNVAWLVCFVRTPGETQYRKAEARVQDKRAHIPLSDEALWARVSASGKLEVVLEARNPEGVAVARAGDALTPLQLTPTAAQMAAATAALRKEPPAPAKAALSPKSPSPLRLPLLLAGAGALAGAGLAAGAGTLAALGGVGAAAVAGGIYAYVGTVVGSGRVRGNLVPVYTGAVPTAAILGVAAAALLVVGLSLAGGGGAAMVARQVL